METDDRKQLVSNFIKATESLQRYIHTCGDLPGSEEDAIRYMSLTMLITMRALRSRNVAS
ncbi:hypothetical protein W02_42140 [Nitrospira sp. KM1]|nr:hypothetical protein W02_42140 [Nitrospira sp. KM1]